MATRSIVAQDIQYYGLEEARRAARTVIDDFVRAGTPIWGEGLEEIIAPLRAAIEGGHVEGLVAMQDEMPLGMVVFQEREGRGRIGFVHSVVDSAAVVDGLERRAVTALRRAGARRIAHEVPLAGGEGLVQAALEAQGFQGIPRLVMTATPSPTPEQRALPEGYTLQAWDDRYLDEVSAVIYEANRGTVDAVIYPAFRTLKGTAAMVQQMAGRDSEPFDPKASGLVLRERQVVGCLIFSHQPPGQGFIDEISIRPAHQGRGLGRALLVRALSSAYEQQLPVVTLAVTEGNAAAVSLYQKLGFAPQQRITAYVWQAE